MATDDDTLLWGSRGRPAALKELTRPHASPGGREEETEAMAFDKLPPLPRPGDPYEPYPRASTKMLPTVHFLVGTAIEGFAYGDLRRLRMIDADDPGQGPVILLYFAAMVPTEVRIEGRHLETLYDLLGQHRLRWVREWPPGRGFADPKSTVITQIKPKVLDADPQE